MPTELRWCPCCRDERPFEAPPCPDGHGVDCPESVCTDCGTGVLVGPTPAAPAAPTPAAVRRVPLAVSAAA